MSFKDVPEIVRWHSVVFQNYNASMMGSPYLTSLYETLALDQNCLSVVAKKKSRTVGWIGGVLDWGAFVKAVTIKCIPKSPWILWNILKKRPKLLKMIPFFVGTGLWEHIRGKVQQKEATQVLNDRKEAALLVIGVVPKWQKKGIGSRMMKEFHQRLISEGNAICTASSYKENVAGNKAFQKAGYKMFYQDCEINRYSKHLV